MPAIQLYLFGKLDIRCDDRPLDKPPTLKSQSLLAYLIYNRHQPQPRERLASMFWGDRAERKARSSLSTSLWHIRRCLPHEDLILADPHTVQFDPQTDLWLDTQVFEVYTVRKDLASLQKAVTLYRGDFLDGFYDDWIVDERYRLEALFAETLTRLMVLQETSGEYAAALATALQLLASNPLREDAHQLVMRSYCQLGQRTLALAQYQRCQQILGQELGVEPMVETTDFYQAILDGQVEIKQVREPLPVQPQTLSVGRNPLDVTATTPLTGREKEVTFLHQLWQESVRGEGRFVLVNGDAGVGKTRLIEEFANQVRWSGGNVAWGRCYEFERGLPYQPITEALRAVLSIVPPGQFSNLPPWSIAEVARLVPEIVEYFPKLIDPVEIQSDQEQARLFSGVARFLIELSSQGPLLIVLEDLHWAGESTLQLVHYLVRNLKDHSVLLAGTMRPLDLGSGHRISALQQQLKHEGLCQSLLLKPLPSDAVIALIQEMSGMGDVVLPLADCLYQETEGNPFFLMEIIQVWFETGVIRFEGDVWKGDFSQICSQDLPLPVGVSDAILARVQRLEQEPREALRLAAVLGQAFDFDLLKTAWDHDDEATLDAIDNLLRHRLIEAETGAQDRDYTFSHHKIREAVYAAIPLRRRQHLHGRAGMAMEQTYEPQMILSDLAFHFEQAQRTNKSLTEKAITYLRKAGEQAITQHANAEAVNYLSRALNLLPVDAWVERFDILLLRAHVNGLQGERATQSEDLTTMEDLAGRLDIDRRMIAALQQGNYFLSTGDYPTALGYMEQALDWARAEKRESQEAEALSLLGTFYVLSGDANAAQNHFKQALTIHRSIGDRLGEAKCLSSLGSAYHMAGEYEMAEDNYQQAQTLSRKAGSLQMEGHNLSLLGRLSRQQGDLEAAQKYNLQALEILRAIGHRDAEAYCLHELGNLYNDLGNSWSAREALEQVVTIFASVKNPRGESYAHVDLGFVYHCLGDDQMALVHCKQGRDGLRSIGDRWGEGGSSNYIGQALEGLGNWEAASETYRRALRLKREIGQHAWAIEDLAGLARVALAQHKFSEAFKYVDEALIWIAQNSIAGMEMPLLVYLTAYQVLLAVDDGERADQVLAEAYDLLIERATKIKDEKLRRSFLENVATNREIMAAIAAHEG